MKLLRPPDELEVLPPFEAPNEMPEWPTDADGRATMPAVKAGVALLVTLLVWSLLAAPHLKRTAEASPIGARRSAALTVLAPFAALSDELELTTLTDGIGRALGREEAGSPGSIPPPEPLPTVGGGQKRGSGNTEPVISSQPLRVPTANRKLRVVVVGDSLSVGLKAGLERSLRPRLVRVVGQGRLSTGLARPDYFNWVAEMRRIVQAFRPDVVVVMTGSNDGQAMRFRDGTTIAVGSGEWADAYRGQVRAMMSAAASGGAHVAWVGLPVMRDYWRTVWSRRLNGFYASEAAGNVSVDYLDAWEPFSRNGGYAAFLRNDRGKTEQVREGDGVHFTMTGYERLARLLVDHMVEVWDLTERAVPD